MKSIHGNSKNILLIQEWATYGMTLGTTSNEVAKLYDASLTQYIGWYDDYSLGGLEATIEKILYAEPQFGLYLSGTQYFQLLYLHIEVGD